VNSKRVQTRQQAGQSPVEVLGARRGVIDGAQKGGTATVLGYTPQYSRLKYMPSRLVQGDQKVSVHLRKFPNLLQQYNLFIIAKTVLMF
jgi:hypothetical protein